jgi:hypothetical protein
MIENVNMSSLRGMMPPQWGGDNKLTDQQKTQAQEIISQYDPDNMTEEDRMSMMEELREAGIHPGEDMKNILEEAGFDMKPPEGKRPPMMSANPMQSMTTEGAPEFFTDFIEKYTSGNLTEDDIDTFITSVKTNAEELKGFLINQIV